MRSRLIRWASEIMRCLKHLDRLQMRKAEILGVVALGAFIFVLIVIRLLLIG